MNPIVTIVLTFTLMGAASAPSQDKGQSWVACGGPSGIFVNLGNSIPSRSDVAAYVVERKAARGGWDTIAARAMGPGSFGEFSLRLKSVSGTISPASAKPAIPAESVWKKIDAAGSLQSLKMWGGILVVRLALGVTIIDTTAIRGASYQYRVTQILKNGHAGDATLSGVVAWPGMGPRTAIKSTGREDDARMIRADWKLAAGKQPAILKALRGDGIRAGLLPYEKARILLSVGKGDSAAVTLIDTGVTPGGIYRYALVSYDYYGNPGATSDTVLAAAFPFFRVSKPQRITVESNDSLGGLLLSWRLNDAKNVHSVKILRSANWDGGFAPLGEVPASACRYLDRNVEPMKKYFYKLTITDALNEESPPTARVFGIYRDLHPPLRPYLATARGTSAGIRLIIARTDLSATALRIFRCKGYGMKFLPLSDAVAIRDSQAVYVDSSASLDPGVSYGYAAMAENASHAQSEFSDTLYARPLITREIKATVFLSAKAVDGTVRLFWPDQRQMVPHLRGFIVMRKNNDSAAATPARLNSALLPAAMNYFTDTAVAEGASYVYSVICVDAFGSQSAPSSPAGAELPVHRPAPPGGLRASASTGGIALSWDEPVDASIASYNVYRYERGSAAIVIGKAAKGQSEFIDPPAPGAGLSFYYLTSMTAKGVESERSDEAEVRR